MPDFDIFTGSAAYELTDIKNAVIKEVMLNFIKNRLSQSKP